VASTGSRAQPEVPNVVRAENVLPELCIASIVDLAPRGWRRQARVFGGACLARIVNFAIWWDVARGPHLRAQAVDAA